jgi:pyruvate,water dikinase
VTYRLRKGLDQRRLRMAVVVQRMVFPRASGVMFTADPLTGHRKTVSVQACFGLGEALVSGRANADAWTVRESGIVTRAIADKPLAVIASPAGGVREEPVDTASRRQPALSDSEVMRLATLGRRIEAHFGAPQDIEWCLADDDVLIVQSRPITTLFPVPVAPERGNRVYVSTGHQQMMTDAMKPLGISMWQLTAARPMYEAAGRLFVDITSSLASPAGRAGILAMLAKSDPLIGDALQAILDRGDFIALQPDADPGRSRTGGAPTLLEDNSAIVAELVAHGQGSNASLMREIRTKSGPALFEFIRADLLELKRIMFDPVSHRAIMAGMEAAWWLNERLEEWIGEKNAADVLVQSAPGNVTSQMGLDLLHVADVIRPHPSVTAFLEHVDRDDFLDVLTAIDGGTEAKDAIETWLARYGMRCAGEIDITRPRWSERPSALVPLILSNVRNFEPGEGERRLEQGLNAARRKEREVLERVRALPDGTRKAEEAKSMIDRLRTFSGFREYPKYFMVGRYFAYRLALLREADRLVESGVLEDREDIYFLTFDELHDVVRTKKADHGLIQQRKDAFSANQALKPPRVITSEGEMLDGAYRSGRLPAGALPGLAVSGGLVEGRARVVFDPVAAALEPGDILVTPWTDPSWTPLFVAIRGLVTEVGGAMTHGAVIAREYGLPAVVGVVDATRRIRDGQRIRVHGTEGYVEILPETDPSATRARPPESAHP